ncbi:MAG: hypothetical protein SPE72_02715 [Alloprevotella sp.]|nr:hypothetical protein [Alloprevotella sp.]
MKLLSRLHETRVVRRLRAMFCAIFLLTVITPTGAQTTVLNGYAYKKITSTTELNTMGEYVLVCEATKRVMTGVASNKGTVGSCTLSDGVFTGYTTAPLTLTILKDGSNYNIKCSGKNLTPVTGSTDITLGRSTPCPVHITFDTEGNVKIGNSNDNNRNIVLYDGKLGHYTTYGKDTYKAVQLYRRVYVINFPEATQGLTTFYNADYRYEVPTSMTIYAVTAAEEGQPVSLTEPFKVGNYVKKGSAYLLKGTPGTTVYLPTEDNINGTVVPGTNLLEGTRTDEGLTSSKNSDVYYYKLAIKDGQPGFYWGAENGAAFQMTKPTTAYLAVPKSAVQQAAGLRIDLDAITGVKSLEMQVGKDLNDGDGQIYTLDGRRCTTVPRKGMYIINGKKVIR